MHDWKEIRQRYGTLIFSAAYRILKRHDQALDCYQEVFLEAFEQCEERPVHNWPALLRWIAVRRALDRLRKERRIAARVDSEKDTLLLPATGEGPGEEIEFRELLDRVRGEVARLPERQAEAFWLQCVEQLTSAEVAEQLGSDANSVGVLVHRARARLREMLADVNPARVEQ
jgi:RNA polymerase sigma-70 factor (ECF subfamily)